MTTPATYADLQTALNDATSGDTLDITGECTGNFTDNTATLTLVGIPTAALDGGGGPAAVMTVESNVTLTITNLLITGGDSNGDAGYGGGINIGFCAGCTASNVTLNGDTQVNGNSAYYNGGGIAVSPGSSLTLNDSAQVDENTASAYGGGIFNDGTVTLNDDTQVDNNTSGSDGGGIDSNDTVNLTGNAQVQGNSNIGIYNVGTTGTCEWTGAATPNGTDGNPALTPYGPPC